MKTGELDQQFRNPGAHWRGKPFWSWNGKLEKEELLRQIDVMKEMGLGGYFMHSRTGLKTEYLSDEWFDLINACAEKGLETGMESWIYDEDRWPSGTCGGQISENPEFRARFMRLDIISPEDFVFPEKYIALFSAEVDGFTFRNCEKYSGGDEGKGRMVLAFSIEEEVGSDFYNGYTWIDVFNRKATDAYLESTHEKYKEKSGHFFDEGLFGNFTDEPNRGTVFDKFNLKNRDPEWMCPWTGQLPAEFEKRFGYNLMERLPEIFLHREGEKISQVKWHYMELLQQLFLENYAEPIHRWHKENNLKLTGHILHEDSLAAQTATAGSVMRYYKHMDYPGIDILGEFNRNYHVVKQLSSAARQFGQKTLLSELYGCSGWQVSFEGHKWVGDWQALFGINLRCHHLSWYTMEGEAKRDLPASILHQSAWYKDYEVVESYFARFGLFLSQGSPRCDLLVLNPVESLWSRIYPGATSILASVDEDMKRLDHDYQQLFRWLAGNRIDFDYGDEGIMADEASIEETEAGSVLKVGQAKYKTVLVAGVDTIRSSTLKLLKQFSEAGGSVVFAGDVPAYVDAIASDEAVQLAKTCKTTAFDCDQIISGLEESRVDKLEVLQNGHNAPDSIFSAWRKDDGFERIVLLNTDRENRADNLVLKIKGSYVEEWDLKSGEAYSRPFGKEGDDLLIPVDLPEAGSVALKIYSEGESDKPLRPIYENGQLLHEQRSFKYRLHEPNVCVLDKAYYRLNQQDWKEDEILKIDEEVRTSLGLPVRKGDMVQPWFREKKNPGGTSIPLESLELDYPFSVEEVPAGDLFLCIERPHMFTVEVNDVALDTSSDEGWWIDTAFRKLRIPESVLVKGNNQIKLKTVFTEGHDLEALFIVGEFAVRQGNYPELYNRPEKLTAGTITDQGFPFYGGRISYEVDLPEGQEDVLVKVAGFEGALVNVLESDGNKTVLPWKPFEAVLSGSGSKVELEIVLTRINTYGPVRHENAPKGYFLHNSGLLDSVNLYSVTAHQ